ncbi:hypothetical protein LH128_13388 [Sphingomonas sp. LH128]|uniref:TPR repeat-containing protein n=1 Tax=Novosphingobium resinovorum TaxID=158500 RepID=A0A1D8A4K4_9SPHN|nr:MULTISPECIES: hypothetical protein [Sphingomonadaceae]AOR77032.1 hypothetical protein BES08_09915 [Novosphingobium resinovorum]EJU11538.1 hypothetical protein LH128_18254 [Sphingomonas sp. LH128]EJU12524.1 hypothetical protein LH128_13388 [Sphingomonas sp. LH128]
MSLTALATAVLLGQSAFSLAVETPAPPQAHDVAYTELASGRTQEAISKLEAGGAAKSDDPATLINLGAAYARAGASAKALSAYRAAVSTPVRYDLELADGSWVDSRFAARRALSGMLAANRMASR